MIYLNSFEDIDTSTKQTIDNYLQFISQLVKGIFIFKNKDKEIKNIVDKCNVDTEICNRLSIIQT